MRINRIKRDRTNVLRGIKYVGLECRGGNEVNYWHGEVRRKYWEFLHSHINFEACQRLGY